MDKLGEKVQCQDGSLVDVKSFFKEGAVVGLYFSAHWCPPCRRFTPELVKWSKQVWEKLTDGQSFHIIFVSSDNTEDAFKEYFAEMGEKWNAVPFGIDTGASKHFEIRGIPTFVLLNGKGETITTDGRSKVTNKDLNFPWSS